MNLSKLSLRKVFYIGIDSEMFNCTHLPLQGVETKVTPPVSHNNNHTAEPSQEDQLHCGVPTHNIYNTLENDAFVEPRNTSQEDQLHYAVPSHNIYNTLENKPLEVRENERMKQFDL